MEAFVVQIGSWIMCDACNVATWSRDARSKAIPNWVEHKCLRHGSSWSLF
jgi:hypothetical protein